MKHFEQFGFRDPVRGSAELDRILGLVRRPPVDLASPRAAALVELMTERLKRRDRPGPCGCAALGRRRCVDRLLPVQAWALYESPLTGGLLAPIGVGAGKTLLDILIATVMPNCRVAALLLPPGLVEQLIAEYRAVSEHFVVPSLVLPVGYSASGWTWAGRPALHVVPYSRFSRPEATDYLERLRPDLILADEAHALKNRGAVRTGRVLRYFAAYPQTRLCAWSGSITSKSIKDFAHLSAFALGDSSPLPLDPDVVEQWAAAVDPSDWPAPAGALKALGEPVREALQRRITETRGVVSTRTGAAGTSSIVLRERVPPKMPAELAQKIIDLRASFTRPDGEELVTALDVARCARELACGFFYRWRFPDRPSLAEVEAWFAARKAWHRELREQLRNPKPHLDSPLLLAKAAIRYYAGYQGELPVWESDAWPRWRDLRDSVRHETEAVWVDQYLVNDAAEWAQKHRGIVWYEHEAFGRAIGEKAGTPVHGGGIGAEARILAEKGDRSIAASIRSHGTGRNGLQFLFNEQLVANPPSSGDAWEQLLGRLNRVGQSADEVVTHVYRHTAELRDAIDRALELAKYIEGITSNTQMLLAADVEWVLAGGR